MTRALDPREFVRVHSGMPEHPKVEPLSDKAFRTLVEAWCLCRRTGNDGRIPLTVWTKRWAAKARNELVGAGLVGLRDGAAVMHDWLEHQPSAGELDARRAVRAEAGRKGGQRSGQTRRSKTRSNSEADASPPHSHETATERGNSVDSGQRNPSRATAAEPTGADTVRTRLPAETSRGGEANASALHEQTLKQNTNGIEPEIEIEKEIEGHPPCGPYVSSARNDETPLGPAVDPTGWKLVRDTVPDDHPHAVRTDLALRAGALLRSGTTESDVRQALSLWLAKPHLGPGALASLVSEVVRNRSRPAPTGPSEGAATTKARGWLDLGAQLAPDPSTPPVGWKPHDQKAIQQ
ncbi:hypothetical protein GZH49_06435 [Nocardia terpenica]|uniref:hypothetical protein n=1 Tax=Nocardia terpenica TaxID=455432 RepID=UPI002FE2E06F